MRDILFRGKRIGNGEWVQVYLFAIWERHYILWGTINGVPDMIEVDPATVGQYTGLTDKHGSKIFEGDVVCYDNSPYNPYCTPTTGKIVWRNGSLCFRHCSFGGPHYRSLCSDDFFAVKCEVIGNIHDTEATPCTE